MGAAPIKNAENPPKRPYQPEKRFSPSSQLYKIFILYSWRYGLGGSCLGVPSCENYKICL